MPAVLETVIPTPSDRATAGEGSRLLSRSLDEHRPVRLRVASEEGAEVELPDSVVRLLHGMLTHLADGQTVTVLPGEAELTTNEAADLLGVSRPHLIKLLDAGKIAFRRVGEHRRVSASDLLRYREENRARRMAVLADLQAEAQELGLGY